MPSNRSKLEVIKEMSIIIAIAIAVDLIGYFAVIRYLFLYANCKCKLNTLVK